MVTKHFLILVAFSLCIITNQAVAQQNFHYNKISWDTVTYSLSKIQQQYDSVDAVRLLEKCSYEYIFEENQTVLYHTVHRKVLVLTDRGIEAFNRVYIAGNKSDLVNLKVRTTKPNGTVNELDRSSIKEIENLENKGNFKIFAIEGIERFSIVEMFYTMRKPAAITGRYTFQDEFPTLRAEYELKTPQSLVFEAKAYNSTFNYSDTIIGEDRIQTFSSISLDALENEKYCAYEANLARIDYTFSLNTEGGEVQNNWLQVVRNYSDVLYAPAPSSDKKIQKQLKKLKVAALSSDAEKIKLIENYIKDHYVIKDLQGIAEIESIDFILKNKFSNNDGITHLFLSFLEQAGIEHRLGITCDRSDARFDKDFVSWHSLNEYVIYFPSIDQYLSPTASLLRLGMLPTGITYNYGVFIKKIGLGNLKTVQPEIRFIPALPMEKSVSVQNVDMKIDIAKKTALVNYHTELSGNEASFIKPYYDFLPQESKNEILDRILKLMGEDTKVISKKITGINHTISAIEEPVIIDCSLEIPSLIEQAGNDYLINVGNTIGEQVEMYATKKRENLIELDYSHCYRRRIVLEIPQGYEAKGLEELVIDKEYGNENGNNIGFKSSFSIENNKIIITVYEYYKDITYPIDQYEQFRTVINAAADFNKKVIVLQAKQ